MPVNTDEQVRKGLKLLRSGLLPFVEQQMQKCYGSDWYQLPKAAKILQRQPNKDGKPHLDTQALLNLICNYWHDVFTHSLDREQRTLVSELRTTRNKSAHDETFSIEDTYRVFDSIARLLKAISAQEVTEVELVKQELLKEILCQHTGKNDEPNMPLVETITQQAIELNKIEFKCLKHIQTNTVIELPPNLSVIHLGKTNDRISPDIDLCGFPNSDIISRVHADILVQSDAYYIEDVGSSNGTYINNRQLYKGDRHHLRVGDRIDLGKKNLVTFLFQLSSMESREMMNYK